MTCGNRLERGRIKFNAQELFQIWSDECHLYAAVQMLSFVLKNQTSSVSVQSAVEMMRQPHEPDDLHIMTCVQY